MTLKNLECHAQSFTFIPGVKGALSQVFVFPGPPLQMAARSDILLGALLLVALDSGCVGVPEFPPSESGEGA